MSSSLQGLLHYFQLVEGCLDLINTHESISNFTYDWIVRTRVDTYWSSPLPSSAFSPSSYVVPQGSRFGGLNDRLGIGTHRTSGPAISRLSLLPLLYSAGYRNLNSESAFLAQLKVSNVTYREARLPFCVVSGRKYGFPPWRYGVPVASMGSEGMLSGAKCRPCKARCKGECVERVRWRLEKGRRWAEYRNGSTVELCDASGEWEMGWEEIYDDVAGKEFAEKRKGVKRMDLGRCVKEWEGMRRKASSWEVPNVEVVCRLGLRRT